jgi:hypothetical protein
MLPASPDRSRVGRIPSHHPASRVVALRHASRVANRDAGYSQACGGYRVDLVKAELGPTSWQADVANWMRRARSGPGQMGAYGSKTAYFWKQSSWGGPLLGSCSSNATSGSVAHESKHGGHRLTPTAAPTSAP